MDPVGQVLEEEALKAPIRRGDLGCVISWPFVLVPASFLYCDKTP